MNSVWVAAAAAASISSACSDPTVLCCGSNGDDMDSLGQMTGDFANLEASRRRLHDALAASKNNHHNIEDQRGGAEDNQDTRVNSSSGLWALRKADLNKGGHPHVDVMSSGTALDIKRDDDGIDSEGGEGDATMNTVPYPFDEWPRRVVAPPGGMLENARAVFAEISSDILVSHCFTLQ